jgi:hypothetical protein
MRVVPVIRDSKPAGAFYHLDDGRVIYLARRQRRHLIIPGNAWAFDTMMLRRCEAEGVSAIGVFVKTGRLFWLTPLKDIRESPKAFRPWVKGERLYALPAEAFRVRPSKRFENIEKAMRIR